MTDRTPHEGGRHTPEDLLDALLAGNRVELLNTMTRALDTDAGLRALRILRTGPTAKIENRASEATAPPPHHPIISQPIRESAPLPLSSEGSVKGDPHPAIELIQDFLKALTVLRRSPDMPPTGREVCMDCVSLLTKLADGLEQRFMARGEAVDLLTEVARRLADLQSELPFMFGLGLESDEIIEAFAERLRRITVVVARMFDEAYDNIYIEY
ncbi:hypothetical protein [Streptomyces sp. DH10]|uniref:hypothetical protein n=1 Tax=Streptomyces sp. DH10 TaxID=3040121 RepID=UPI002441AB75|nr:hypothetical protein [Streptomyces sp. DH10]MDG9709369.1 hypothetical protein [Streptomyces sp. DH10]